MDVEQWGVRPSPFASGKNKPMEVGHLVSYQLVQPRDGKVLWKHGQLFLSGKERTLAEYQNSPTTLVEDVRTSQERYCGIIANQLIY